jgi:hypothetical protein
MPEELYSFLSPDNCIRTNLNIAKAIGLETALVYSALIKKHDEWQEKNLIDERGFFFCDNEWLFLWTALKNSSLLKALRVLERNGLIAVETRKNGKQYVRITYDDAALLSVMSKGGKVVWQI